jgi:hypothetical protein
MMRELVSRLDAAGYEVMHFAAAGMANENGATFANDADANDPETKAHEEWHVELAKGGYTDDEPLTNILNESSASAVGLYSAREAYKAAGDPERLRKVEEQVAFSKGYGRDLLEAYEAVREAKARGEDLEPLRARVWRTASETRWQYERKNWASLLTDITYFGAFGPCYDALDRNGEEGGKRLIKEAFDLTNRTGDANAGKDLLASRLPEVERAAYAGRLEPVEEDAPNRFFREGEGFHVGLWTKDAKVARIFRELYAGYRERFEGPGEMARALEEAGLVAGPGKA